MTSYRKLAALLAATSAVVLSASSAHAGIPLPPRPTITVPVVKPTIPTVAVKPTIQVGVPTVKPPVSTVKPPLPGTKPWPTGVKPWPTSCMRCLPIHPQTNTHPPSQWPVHPPVIMKKPVPTVTAPQPAPATNQGPPKPGTVPINTTGSAPAATPASNPAPASAPAAQPAAHPAANPPAPHANAAPPPTKKPDVWKPVLYPGFTDQNKKPIGYYVDGKLVMGMKSPSGTQCVSTIGFQRLGGGPVSTSGGAGMIQITAVQCYVKA